MEITSMRSRPICMAYEVIHRESNTARVDDLTSSLSNQQLSSLSKCEVNSSHEPVSYPEANNNCDLASSEDSKGGESDGKSVVSPPIDGPPVLSGVPLSVDDCQQKFLRVPEDGTSSSFDDVDVENECVLNGEYLPGKKFVSEDTLDMSGVTVDVSESQYGPVPPSSSDISKHKKKHKKKKHHHHNSVSDHRRKHAKKKRKKEKKRQATASQGAVKPITLSAVVKGTTIVSVQCDEFDMRNKIKLRRTAEGWVSTPVTDISDKRVQDDPTAVSEPLDVTQDHAQQESQPDTVTWTHHEGVVQLQTDVASQTSDDALDSLKPLPELYISCNDPDETDTHSDPEQSEDSSSPRRCNDLTYDPTRTSSEHPLDLTQSSLKCDSNPTPEPTHELITEAGRGSPSNLPPVKERKRAHLDHIVTKIKKARTHPSDYPDPLDTKVPLKIKTVQQIQMMDCKQWDGLQISPVGSLASPMISPTTSVSPGGLTPSEGELITAVRNSHLELPAYLLIPGFQLVSLFGNPIAELPKLIVEQINHIKLVRKNPRALVDSSFIYLPTTELIRLLSDDPNNKHLPRLLATSSSVSYAKLEPREKFRDIHLWQSKEFGVNGQVSRVASGGFYRHANVENHDSITSWKKWECLEGAVREHIPELIPINNISSKDCESVSPKIRVKPDLQGYPQLDEESALAHYLVNPGSLMGVVPPNGTVSPGDEPNFPILQSFLNCPPPVGYPSYPELTKYLETTGGSHIPWHRPTPFWTPNHSSGVESRK